MLILFDLSRPMIFLFVNIQRACIDTDQKDRRLLAMYDGCKKTSNSVHFSFAFFVVDLLHNNFAVVAL